MKFNFVHIKIACTKIDSKKKPITSLHPDSVPAIHCIQGDLTVPILVAFSPVQIGEVKVSRITQFRVAFFSLIALWLFLCLYLPVQCFPTTADSQHRCIYRFLSLIILIVLLPFYLFNYFFFSMQIAENFRCFFFQTNGLVACPGFIPSVLEGALSLLLPDTQHMRAALANKPFALLAGAAQLMRVVSMQSTDQLGFSQSLASAPDASGHLRRKGNHHRSA